MFGVISKTKLEWVLNMAHPSVGLGLNQLNSYKMIGGFKELRDL